MNKQRLRMELRKCLKDYLNTSIESQRKAEAHKVFFKKLIALPEFHKSQKIGIFISIPMEISTIDFIEYCISFLKKSVFIPHWNKSKMSFVQLKSIYEIEKFQDTKQGYKMPLEDGLLSESIDFIVVPGLAFDFHGNRLGQGGGYYDYYLNHCTEKPFTCIYYYSS